MHLGSRAAAQADAQPAAQADFRVVAAAHGLAIFDFRVSSFAMALCAQCDGTGWRRVALAGGYSGVERCDHGAPGLEFEAVSISVNSVFRARLSGDEVRIHDLILERRGREQAICIREVVDRIWPEGIVPRTNQEEQDCHREVKRVIRRMRDEGRYPVAASKSDPAGYFFPATAQERQECHDRMAEEGWKLIRLSQLFVRDEDLGERRKNRADRLKGQSVVGSRQGEFVISDL